MLAPFVWGIAFAFVGSACMAGDDICSDDGWRVVSVLFFVAWAVVAWAFVVAIVLPVRPIRDPKEVEPEVREDSPPSPGESRN